MRSSKEPAFYYSCRFYEDYGDKGDNSAQSGSGADSANEPDTVYEYRYVEPLCVSRFTDRYLALKPPGSENALLSESECAKLGIVQSRGWKHVAFFDGRKTLVFRRPRSDAR